MTIHLVNTELSPAPRSPVYMYAVLSHHDIQPQRGVAGQAGGQGLSVCRQRHPPTLNRRPPGWAVQDTAVDSGATWLDSGAPGERGSQVGPSPGDVGRANGGSGSLQPQVENGAHMRRRWRLRLRFPTGPNGVAETGEYKGYWTKWGARGAQRRLNLRLGVEAQSQGWRWIIQRDSD